MQNTLLYFVSLSLLMFILASCSDNPSEKNFDMWLGQYRYEEEPIKAIAGYSMTMSWALSIDRKGDSCRGVLEVNGQQTHIRLLTDITGDNNFIVLKYDKVLDGFSERLQKGDTLFTLYKNGNGIKTKWASLEPRLAENPPKECTCFDMAKTSGH